MSCTSWTLDFAIGNDGVENDIPIIPGKIDAEIASPVPIICGLPKVNTGPA